jgi:manganese/zinc/iron transport system substrate-binding protein
MQIEQVMSKSLRFAAVVLGIVALTGCGGSAGSTSDSSHARKDWTGHKVGYPIRVVATTGQVADLVRNIGGKHVAVESLMGPSVDPHQYKASFGDNRKLAEADVVFYNGLHLEGRMSDSLENMAKRQPVFAVADAIIERAKGRLRKPPEFEGGYDPHVWFDATLWTIAAEYVRDCLIELDPEHQEDYRGAAAAYTEKLKVLDIECRQQLSAIPPNRRVLVTAHDAFGYFGKAYGIEVHGLQGISTADETDVATKQALVDLLVERKIKAVFVESSVPHKNVENLIDLCAQRNHTLVRGGELFSDAMGEDGTLEATYLGMMRYNVKTIVEALK